MADGKWVAAVVGVAAASLLITVPARAHEGGHGRVVVVDRIEPSAEGVVATVVPTPIGKVALAVAGETRVVVLGADGDRILRIGPGGVEANASSPDWYRANEALGIATVPVDATSGAPERWVRVSAGSRWEWFDHRLHPSDEGAVTRWSIPLEIDGAPARVIGRSEPSSSRLQVTVDAVTVPDGVEVVGVSQPLAALTVRPSGEGPVEVLGPDGELFARIGAFAQVNRRSPVWAAVAQAANRDLLGAVLDPAAVPELVDFAPTAQLTWPDPRVLPAPGETEARWSVPIRVSGQVHLVEGRTRFVEVAGQQEGSRAPESDGVPVGWSVAAVVGTVALVGALVVGRRRGSGLLAPRGHG